MESLMGGLKGFSQMEAMLSFKEKEIEDLTANYESQIASYKAQKK